MNLQKIFDTASEHKRLNKIRPGGSQEYKTMAELQESPLVEDVDDLRRFITQLIKTEEVIIVTSSLRQGSMNAVHQFFNISQLV